METKANQLMAKARNIDAQQQTTRRFLHQDLLLIGEV